MLNNETLENLDLVDLLAVINAKAEQEAVEFNELSEVYNDLVTTSELQGHQIAFLEKEMLSFGLTLDKKVAQSQSAENDRLKLKGQLATAQTDLKTLKALGDIKSVNRRLKEQKAKNLLATAALEKLKKDRNDWVKERSGYIDRLSYLEDFPMFVSEAKETISLHGQKINMLFDGKERLMVVLKYWNPCGLGRLVTFNAERLTLADAGLTSIEDVAGMSNEMVDFCVGWYTENVITVGKEQNLIIKTKKAS